MNAIGSSSQTDSPWPIPIGAQLTKGEIMSLVGGGNLQAGITRPKGWTDVLAFSRLGHASSFGYHEIEGPQENGTFLYTGEGTQGDQKFERGNKRIRETLETGGLIRLFASNNPRGGYTYVGTMKLDSPPWSIELDRSSGRQLIVFRLRRVVADYGVIDFRADPSPRRMRSIDKAEDLVTVRARKWLPKHTEPTTQRHTAATERSISFTEHELEERFARWQEGRGHVLRDLVIQASGSMLRPDVFDKTAAEIVEAKGWEHREYVRTAIGQVLDYVHNYNLRIDIDFDELPSTATPAILLPNAPEADLIALCQDLGIRVYVPVADEFIELATEVAAS